MIPICMASIFAPAIAQSMRKGMSCDTQEQPKKAVEQTDNTTPMVWARHKPKQLRMN